MLTVRPISVVQVLVSYLILDLVWKRSVNAANSFQAPSGLETEVLGNDSVLVLWRFRERYRVSSFRITLYPEYADYKIMKDVPGTSTSTVFNHLLPDAEYNLTIQSGYNDYFGKKSEAIRFKLEKTDGKNSGRNVTISDGPSWLEVPLSSANGPKTEEIVIVSLIVVFWIFVICVFTSKWAKIRVIEPRYFDYNFLLKYDKAFAVRNAAISVYGINGPRKSIAPSLTGIRINGARPSISAVSMRLNSIHRGSVMYGGTADSYSNLNLPLHPSRPFLLPLRLQHHRYSHDVRMELHPPINDESMDTPTTICLQHGAGLHHDQVLGDCDLVQSFKEMKNASR